MFFYLFIFKTLFIYFWLCWVLAAAHGFSLVAESRGSSPVVCPGFSLWWLLLLWNNGSKVLGLSYCGTLALLLCCMWDLPGPGIQPMSPALVGGFLTTRTPRKPLSMLLHIRVTWKRSVFIPIPNKGNAKECSNYHTIALFSHASKVMLKILQARLQQYVNRELPDVQAGFRKGRGTRDQMANICWIMEKAREFQKNISALLTMPKPLTVWITINCGKF